MADHPYIATWIIGAFLVIMLLYQRKQDDYLLGLDTRPNATLLALVALSWPLWILPLAIVFMREGGEQ